MTKTNRKSRMTYKQFLEELSKQKDKGWFVTMGGVIRTTGGTLSFSCPISALQDKSAHLYAEVAKDLGLSEKMADKIANAADSLPKELPATHQRIRRDLLQTLGLKEVQLA